MTTAIRSISDLEEIVTSWERRVAEPNLGYPSIWYRGQPEDQPLQPGLLRPAFLNCCDGADHGPGDHRPTSVGQRLWEREQTINKHFRRMAATHVPAGSSNLVLYLLAQHHGLPTRLLDWSMNSMAAIYFAISGMPDSDGVLYVMNPLNLGPILELRDPRVQGTVNAVFGDEPIPIPRQIIPLLPDHPAGRMREQAACFTLHTPPKELNDGNVDRIDPVPMPKVERYVIPKQAKPGLALTLRRLGVTAASLFPDLDHVAQELRDAWKI